MKILVAEDDEFTRKGLTDIFEEEGYTVIPAENGEQAVALFNRENPDLVFLDIMMPKKNGYDACRMIRKEDQDVPVIFLSAKSEEIDKVLGLELGADDYISKPFGIKEVVARVRAVTRRVNRARAQGGGVNAGESEAAGSDRWKEPFAMQDLKIYPAELKAFRGEQEIELSLRDVKLLSLFAENRDKVLDRDTIYDAGWGVSHLPNSRTLDQHISQLRKKIEKDPKNPEIIVTVHNAGYRSPINFCSRSGV